MRLGLALLLLRITSAELIIYQTRVSPTTIITTLVNGVAVLNLDRLNDLQIRTHLFGCSPTTGNARWANVRFPISRRTIFFEGRSVSVIAMELRTSLNSLGPSITPNDAGVYTCRNNAGEQSTVNIRAGSRAITAGDRVNQYGTIFGNATLRVYAVQYPIPLTSNLVRWIRPSGEIINPLGTKYSLASMGRHLQIFNVAEEDAGLYSVNLGDSHPDSTTTINMILRVNTRVLIHPRSSLVYDGDQFQLNCTFIGHNIMIIRWERAGPFDLPGGPRWGMTTDKISTNVGSVRAENATGVYRTSEISTLDRGSYRCVGRTSSVVGEQDIVYSKYGRITILDNPYVVSNPMPLVALYGSSVRLSCEFSGNPINKIHIVWEKLGGNFPSRIRSVVHTTSSHATISDILNYTIPTRTSDFVISSVDSTDQGLYRCEASRRFFLDADRIAVSEYAELIVLTNVYMATITHEGTGKASTNQVLQIVLEHGDPPPTFSCFSFGFPPPTITWKISDGTRNFPDGVDTVRNTQGSVLVWSRRPEFTDSGQYLCNVTNNYNESSTAILELLVRFSPTVFSVFPNSPVEYLSSSTFGVPVGHRGTVATCAGFGWPIPTIQWLKDDQNSSLYSKPVMIADSSPFVRAILRWPQGFFNYDAGNYTCIVQTNHSDQSRVISLQPLPDPVCYLETNMVYFQIRLLNANCYSWDVNLRQLIASSFLRELVNAVGRVCRICTITSNDIRIVEGPTCSSHVDRAAVFKGIISTAEVNVTEQILCALSIWQRREPTVTINDQTYTIDRSCTILLKSPSSTECPGRFANRQPVVNLSVIIGATIGGVVLILLIQVVLSFMHTVVFANRSGLHAEIY